MTTYAVLDLFVEATRTPTITIGSAPARGSSVVITPGLTLTVDA